MSIHPIRSAKFQKLAKSLHFMDEAASLSTQVCRGLFHIDDAL